MIKYFLSICFMFLSVLNLFCQEKIIKGVVLHGETNKPLSAVTIQITTDNKKTSSSIDGTFTLSVPSQDSLEITFSNLGYKTLKVKISKNETQLSIKLFPSIDEIDEVVVVGYGVSRKKDLTGAIGMVTGESITKRQTTQISQALQGASPGLMVTRSNSSPGTSTNIKIRGVTTIGNTDPLVIVDGVPVNSIDDVNPNDVENISILKDASSAAIYGSRAAAGVILISTKRAKGEHFSVDYNLLAGIEKPTVMPEFQGVQRYMQLFNEMKWNDAGNGDNQYPTYAPDFIDAYIENNKKYPTLYPITDWTGIIIKNFSPRQSHAISINGGTGKLASSMSIGYDKTDGLYNGLNWDRYTVRINNDLNLSKFLSFNFDANLRHYNRANAIKDPMYFSRIAAPLYHAGWSDGTVGEGKNGSNDWGIINKGGFNNLKESLFSGRIAVNIMPIEGLKITGLASPSINYHKQKVFSKAVEWYSPNDPEILGGFLSDANTTSLKEGRNDEFNLILQLFANYNKSFANHHLEAMIGNEQFYRKFENLGASRDQYQLTQFPYLDLGPLEMRGNNGGAYEYAYRSYFSRLGYNYNDKYLLQLNVRTDGSSRFAREHRWGVFPSFSAGWVLSREPFFNVPIVDFLKLRTSWGRLGNERIGNYPYQSTINFFNTLFYSGNEIISKQTASLSQYVVQDISWETTESYNIGFDATFLKNRLKVTAEYYKKETKDMLLTLQIPMYLGFENPDQNAGKMHTKGWEGEIKWNDNLGDFQYHLAFNISDSRSVMGSLAGTQFLGDQVKIEGSEFNEWFGYKSLGIYQNQDQLNGSAKTSAAVTIGDIQYQDISGPEGIPDGKISPEYDKVFLGGSLPRYLFGGNLGLAYKGFDLNVDFQGVGKSNARLTPLMVQPFVDNWGNVPAFIEGRYWSYYNSNEQNQKAIYPRVSSNGNANNYVLSDRWLMNGRYFRFKNITLGYSLNPTWLEKIKIQKIRLFASVNDVAVFSHFPKGWDPEVGTSAYPITTSFIAGLSFKY